MTNIQNPFHTLYVTERVNELDFPAIFSPTLIPLVLPLFQPGNVIVCGTQGTGKSMLLALLDTDIRLAFWKNKNNPDPLESAMPKFVGANINLSTSLVTKFNERRFSADKQEDIARSQAVFSDYFNTWIIRDLLNSLQRLIVDAPKEKLKKCGITSKLQDLKRALKVICNSIECNCLTGTVPKFDEVIDLLSKRLRTYLDFINFRIDEIPQDIWSSITGIGEPLSAVSKILKETNVLDCTTEVIITIDQCEELLRLEQIDSEEREYGRFLSILDKLISSRDKAVSYRLGTRPNAIWQGKSEEVRDYIKIDLDKLFRNKETSRGLFRNFAEDVFRRRLVVSGVDIDDEKDLLNLYFGRTLSAKEKAEECASSKNPSKALGLEPDWSSEIKIALDELGMKNILSAKLGEAWVRQTVSQNIDLQEISTAITQRPWEGDDRQWWRKERNGQAILQIAASNKQRIPYSGKRDVLALSGENILVLATICQKIWESWMQTIDIEKVSDIQVPRPFQSLRQDEGIRAASNIWHSKMSSAPSGDRLRRFVDELGKKLKIQLRSDKSMSYPGANGISLRVTDLESDPTIRILLNDATAEGFLQERQHTPKSTSRGPSRKWYTHPILAPYYELTVAHTKEPLYLNIEELRRWLEKAKIIEPRKKVNSIKKSKSSKQKSLFDFETDL